MESSDSDSDDEESGQQHRLAGKQRVSQDVERDNKRARSDWIPCESCDKIFSPDQYEPHARSCEARSDSDPPVSCEVCGADVKWSDFQQHQEGHLCEVCNLAIPPAEYEAHVESCKASSGCAECGVCGELIQIAELNKHEDDCNREASVKLARQLTSETQRRVTRNASAAAAGSDGSGSDRDSEPKSSPRRGDNGSGKTPVKRQGSEPKHAEGLGPGEDAMHKRSSKKGKAVKAHRGQDAADSRDQGERRNGVEESENPREATAADQRTDSAPHEPAEEGPAPVPPPAKPTSPLSSSVSSSPPRPPSSPPRPPSSPPPPSTGEEPVHFGRMQSIAVVVGGGQDLITDLGSTSDEDSDDEAK